MSIHQESFASVDFENLLPESVAHELGDGLIALWRAYDYARNACVDRWEFALEIQQFYEQGLTHNELRWLVAKGIVEHGRETTAYGDARRSFKLTHGLTFSASSAFVLSKSGAGFASQFVAVSSNIAEASTLDKTSLSDSLSMQPLAGNGVSQAEIRLRPTWDARCRELRVAGKLVKRFRVPAASQERVLAAFEEEAWPAFIDDPLPAVADGVPKQRLQNAIKRLNNRQTNRLIHFHGDGSGEGIGWTLHMTQGVNGDSNQVNGVNGHRAGSKSRQA
jgi:hypothetical protein